MEGLAVRNSISSRAKSESAEGGHVAPSSSSPPSKRAIRWPRAGAYRRITSLWNHSSVMTYIATVIKEPKRYLEIYMYLGVAVHFITCFQVFYVFLVMTMKWLCPLIFICRCSTRQQHFRHNGQFFWTWVLRSCPWTTPRPCGCSGSFGTAIRVLRITHWDTDATHASSTVYSLWFIADPLPSNGLRLFTLW